MTGKLTDQDLLNLTAEQAVALVERGKETAVWALLQLSALARNAPVESKPPIASSTPSSQIPTYAKPAAKKGRRKRGRPAGHAGACRRPPLSIDRRQAHTLGECPECGAADEIRKGSAEKENDPVNRFPVERRSHGWRRPGFFAEQDSAAKKSTSAR